MLSRRASGLAMIGRFGCLFAIAFFLCRPPGTQAQEDAEAPWADVRSLGAVGDGVADDTEAIRKAFDLSAAEGKALYFGGKGRHYKVTATIEVTAPVNAFGDGAEIVQFTPDIDLFRLDTGRNSFDWHWSGLRLGTVAGKGNALYLRRVHQSTFENIRSAGAGNAFICIYGSLKNTFQQCIHSNNYRSFAPVGKPVYGFYQMDDADMSSNANSYIACSVEGVSGAGFHIAGGQSCTLHNTVSEGNGSGMYLTGDNHGVYGAHFEKNHGYDLRVENSRGTSLVNITATGLVETAGPDTSSIFISGRMRDITIGEGTKHAVLSNVCVILGGIITDNGIGTVRMGITNSRGHTLRSRYPGLVQWLSETVTLDGGVDYDTDAAWTDLDLTSATSPEARFVFLQLRHKKTCGAGDTLRLRRKGDTPQVPVECIVPAKRRPFVASAFCALGEGQVMEYFATDASDTEITVLGYIEGAPGGAGPADAAADPGTSAVGQVVLPAVWQVKLDPEDAGVTDAWFAPELRDEQKDDWHPVSTHMWRGWDKQGMPVHAGYAWYRVAAAVPGAAKRKHAYLYFGAVDEQAWLWVNGAAAGEHTCKSERLGPESMWAKSFFLEVTPHIRYVQENQLSVRVHNDGAMGGVWQPVYLFTSDEPLTLDEMKKLANRQDEKLIADQ